VYKQTLYNNNPSLSSTYENNFAEPGRTLSLISSYFYKNSYSLFLGTTAIKVVIWFV